MKLKIQSKNFFKKFKVFDLIIIAIVAALGIAAKPVIVPLVHIITGPLFIPGGAIAGGFYMMWIVIGAGLVAKRGAATLIALVQAILVIAIGTVGTHGILSIVTYLLPGIAVELVLLLSKQKVDSIFSCFFAGMAANIAGTVLSNFVFFKLPAIPLILTIAGASLSGGLGGLLAFVIVKNFKKLNLAGFGNAGRDG
ncbi:MAG: ECF transporter S component, partial [Actinobacteria bacterium]|nr:ECF transporter S component [Actinomycetota bacterium]